MSDVLVYATLARADLARDLLAHAGAATGLSVSLELYSSGGLYQRLGPRHGQPWPDVVLWYGPYAAQAAASAGLVQAYQPASVADQVAHEPGWRWTALDYAAFSVAGSGAVGSFDQLATVPRLAMADPERSEAGMLLLLASLDRARQRGDDVEAAWNWWSARARAGMLLAEKPAAALDLLKRGQASHVVGLGGDPSAVPLSDLPLVPHAVALGARSPNRPAALRLLDWLVSEDAAAALPLSPWRLPAAAASAPGLDVAWGTQQYSALRARWAQSAFGPTA